MSPAFPRRSPGARAARAGALIVAVAVYTAVAATFLWAVLRGLAGAPVAPDSTAGWLGLIGLWVVVLAVWPGAALSRAAARWTALTESWHQCSMCGTRRPFAWWVQAHEFAERRGWWGYRADWNTARAARTNARRRRREERERAARAGQPAPFDEREAQIAVNLLISDAQREWTHPPGGVRCEVCGKRFASRRGLADHQLAKHGITPE